jgi:hypothetical protein
MRKNARRGSLLGVALAVLGCSSFGPFGLAVVARAERGVVTPDEPAVIEVTAVNMGDSRVQWGNGSSTCQLGLAVLVDGEEVQAFSRRACTSDYRPHALGPGETRRETFEWDGRIFRSSTGPAEPLAPGVYEVYGVAGDLARSRTIRIRVDGGS